MDLNHVRLDMHTRLIPIVGFPMDHSSASYAYTFPVMRSMPRGLMKGSLNSLLPLRACDLMHIDRFTPTMPLKTPIIPC